MNGIVERIAAAVDSNDLKEVAEYIARHEPEFYHTINRVFDKKTRSLEPKLLMLRIVDRLQPKLAISIVEKALRDNNEKIRVRGLQATYRTMIDSLNTDIERILLDKANCFETRKWALHILASTDHAQFGQAIRKIVRDYNECVELRREAIFALTNVADDKSIGLLCAMLGDGEERIRQAAAWALGRVSSPVSINCLLAALEDEKSMVREWAIRALRDMDDARALQGLADAIRQSEPEKQVRLIRLVAEKRSEIILRAITEALESSSVAVRREAAWALGVSPYPPAATILYALLNDEDQQVRTYAKRALSRLGVTSHSV